MPLSEHEQRMLDEIERALYEDDPKFATSVNVSRIRRRRPICTSLAAGRTLPARADRHRVQRQGDSGHIRVIGVGDCAAR